MKIKPFKIEFIRSEPHLLLPNVTSIILAQNLYDILFQYAISPEKERQLQAFIALLEAHIKSKTRAPFSLPLSELAFLDEGLQELRLLNWMEVPVSVFQLSFSDDASEDDQENILEFLKQVFTFKKRTDSNEIYVYPLGLTAY